MKLNKEDLREWLIKNLKWIVLFFCVICFSILAENVFHKEIIEWDIVGYQFISTYLMSDYATIIAKVITQFGGAIFLIVIAILLLLFIKNKKIGIAICLNLAIIAGFNATLKNILQRPRPTEYRLINETGYSFPSGHSAVSMAFYGFIIYLIYKYVKNKYIKWTLISLLSILTISIGVSRIYLGVHYTSDVLAGFLVSISYLVLYISIVNKFLIKEE